jgi:DNA-binding SARP family transcriptional activator
VLGPLEVVCGGRVVAIRGGKERALLVRLALQSGRVVSAERLVESLWDGQPPVSADVSVRVLVSRVRRALSAAGAEGVIHTRSPGYVLVADDVDAARFDDLSRRGRAELAEGRPAEAAATLGEALALWRGDTLAEVISEQLRVEATRLEQNRLATLEARVEADLACGRHADVLGELEALCRTHPLREGLWACWITALYRCARQADALGVYQELRRTLAEELGIDPSPRLRRLEAAVLTQDPMLASPPGTQHSDGPGAMPFPAALRVLERVALMGRDHELQAALAAWGTACSAASGVALVSGEAGIGKSRLLRELAREVHRRGAIALYGRCDEELVVPYQPFVECLSSALADVSDDVLADVDPRQLGELTRLIPGLVNRRPGLPAPAVADSDIERYLLFGAVGSLLTALARQAPVMTILDDLQWAQRPTLQMLRHLARLNLGRVLIVGAYRDGERSDGTLVQALGALAREAPVTRITPGGLSRSHAISFMTAIAGQEPDEAGAELADYLHRETGGNPFYLVEMLAHLVETGVIARGVDGRSTAGVEVTVVGLPVSIREVLRARLARLGADAARVLADAAVIGQEFEVDLLAQTSDLGVDRLLELLEVAGRTGLVNEVTHRSGRFRFAHALVQHTVYNEIGLTRRTRTHARVAAAMEALGGREPGEVAFHFLAGITPATTAKAIHYARAAGERALATSAPDEAVRWYSAALTALPRPRNDADHAAALVDLGIAQRQAGHAAYRDTLLAAAEMAQRHGADDLLVRAALATDRGGSAASVRSTPPESPSWTPHSQSRHPTVQGGPGCWRRKRRS